MGGESIFRVRADDPNRNVIVETMAQGGARSVMAQRYIPEIRDGDKRVLLIDGKPVPHCLARIPKPGESRGNLAAGGTGVAQPLSARDREIAEALGPEARRARPAAGGPGRDRRLPHRGQRHQPDLLPRDPGPDRLRRRRHVHRRRWKRRSTRMIGVLIDLARRLRRGAAPSAEPRCSAQAPSRVRQRSASSRTTTRRRCWRSARLLAAQLDDGDGVLVLTDMFGATPCNIALAPARRRARRRRLRRHPADAGARATYRDATARCPRRCSARSPAAPRAWCT